MTLKEAFTKSDRVRCIDWVESTYIMKYETGIILKTKESGNFPYYSLALEDIISEDWVCWVPVETEPVTKEEWVILYTHLNDNVVRCSVPYTSDKQARLYSETYRGCTIIGDPIQIK